MILCEQASLDEIKSAFREMAMVYHPDRARRNSETNTEAAALKWQRLTDASATLFDEVKRRLYDIKMGFTVLSEEEVRDELSHL